jgi:hypothetical protein
MPGLRELRAPLAAGYLWLLALYLAIEPHVPDAKDAHGLYATLLHLRDAASSVGVAVAISFAAYIVGSLSEGLLGRLWQEDRLESAGSRLWTTPYTSNGAEALQAEISARTQALDGVSQQGRFGWATPFVESDDRGRQGTTGSPDLDALVHEYQVFSAPAAIAGTSRRVLIYEPGVPDGVSWWQGPESLNEDTADPMVRRFLSDRVVREFRLMRTRLIGEEPQLFALVDRLQSEAEFRFAIVPPLAALGIAVAYRSGAWYGIVAVLTVSVVAIWTLWRQGVLRLRQSGDALLDALSVRRVASPTLERLDAAVKTLTTSKT